MEVASVQHVVQGGAVGISLVLTWLIYKISMSCNKNSNKIIEVVEKNAAALSGLIAAIKEMSQTTKETKKSIEENTSITRETKNLIDTYKKIFSANKRKK